MLVSLCADPELEKRRQDALKLKEKDEEKRRAEAAMSTAMAALGGGSLARFTANYGKGVSGKHVSTG